MRRTVAFTSISQVCLLRLCIYRRNLAIHMCWNVGPKSAYMWATNAAQTPWSSHIIGAGHEFFVVVDLSPKVNSKLLKPMFIAKTYEIWQSSLMTKCMYMFGMKLQGEGDTLASMRRCKISWLESKRKCVAGQCNACWICSNWRRIGGSDVVML
jgi:hypothetical protein